MSSKVCRLALHTVYTNETSPGGGNPLDSYTFKTTLVGDVWAIDATVAEILGSWYLFFSGQGPDGQSLYAAKLSNAYTLASGYNLISAPTLSWEQEGAPVNEGPQVLVNGSNIWLTYSASYCESNRTEP